VNDLAIPEADIKARDREQLVIRHRNVSPRMHFILPSPPTRGKT
jgi:uncharacterized beta-barrel protein YwiB (DUF1934 family)